MKSKWLSPRLLLPASPYLALAVNQNQYDKLVKGLGVPLVHPFVNEHAHGTTHSFDNAKGETVCIVGIDPSLPTTGSLTILAHEAVHVWQVHRSIIGEGDPSSEMEAYCISNIFEALLDEWLRLTGRRL